MGRPKLYRPKLDEILNLKDQGFTFDEIAKRFNITVWRIWSTLRENNISYLRPSKTEEEKKQILRKEIQINMVV